MQTVHFCWPRLKILEVENFRGSENGREKFLLRLITSRSPVAIYFNLLNLPIPMGSPKFYDTGMFMTLQWAGLLLCKFYIRENLFFEQNMSVSFPDPTSWARD